MKKEVFKFLILLMVAIGAGPLGAQVYKWSATAANNATADPNINWSEGQSPSSINDSARAMMQQIALWRKDNLGTNLQAFGGPTAYTVTSNEVFASTATMAGAQITFFMPGVTNAAGVTLNVDGLGAFPILTGVGAPVAAGALNIQSVYTVTFSATSSAFMLQNYFANSFNIPLGAYLFSSGSSAPNANFVATDGSCISRSTYAAYFSLVGTAYGACDGVTTFAVPDLRGRVPAMLDGGAGRLTSAANGCGVTFNSPGIACGSESQTLTLAQLPAGITSVGAALPVSVTTSAILLSNGNTAQNLQGGTTGFGWSNSPTVGTVGATGNTTTGQSVTSNNTSSTAHPNVQPTYGVTAFVRVL